jgi:hypothetical protein
MALIKLGSIATGISGSIAGVTYARNSAGYYGRARTYPVNPNTTAQIVMRSAVKYFTARWHEVLTSTMRNTWNAYAQSVSMKNKLGESIKLSGFNMYVRYNTFRIQNGNSKADSCLGAHSLPGADAAFSVLAYASVNKIYVTWDPLLEWCSIPASILGVYCGQPQLSTRNFFGGPWKNGGPIPGNQTPPYQMTAPYTLTTGAKIWVYSRIATGPTDGRLSEPMYASTIVVAAPP